MSGIVWLALDGVGHPADAPPDSAWEQELPALGPLTRAGLALDTRLGVPGLPQSGTGQSCWLTGRDAVRAMGEHFGPYPGPTLQTLLRQHSLPVRLTAAGGRAAILNFYPPAYFAAHARRPRHGCFPYSFLAAGLSLNPAGVPNVSPTLGLSYGSPWTATHTPIELRRQGQHIARAARQHDLLVLDLWLSDLLGHQGGLDAPPELLPAARRYFQQLDALIAGLQDGGARLMLSSDHGNIENLSVKAHTLARVPFAGQGVALGQPANIAGAGAVVASWFGLSAEHEKAVQR